MADKPKTPEQQEASDKRIKRHVIDALDRNAAVRRELQAVMDHMRRQTSPKS